MSKVTVLDAPARSFEACFEAAAASACSTEAKFSTKFSTKLVLNSSTKFSSFWAGFAKWVRSVIMCAYVNLRSSRVLSTLLCYHLIKTPDFIAPPNLVKFKKKYGKWLFQKQRSHQVHPLQYIWSAWKVVQMTQPEFVDSQVYFDALVLQYLS
jgi:hypothetical protein